MVITDEDIAYLSDLAPAFDPAKAYVVPDMIIADGILKMCVAEGIGNAATFVDASLQDVIKAVIAQSQTPESLVAKLVDLAPEYRIGEEYEVDDLVVKDGKLQMCVQAEEGEPPLFQPTTVEAAIAKLREKIADVREIAERAAGDVQEAKEKSEEALSTANSAMDVAEDAMAVADSASNRVGLVEALIPNEATPDNQLADKDFVNSSVATNTATFIRTFNLISDLNLPLSDKDNYEAVGAAIADYISQYMPRVTPDMNDYCFVQIPRTETELETYVRIDRYKYTLDQSDDSSSSSGDGSSSPIDDDMGSDPEVGEDPGYVWKFEFSLNNSSFTAEQWAAINSGITSAAVIKLNALPDATTLANVLDSKVSTSTTVNGKALSQNITLYGSDIIKDFGTQGPTVRDAIESAQAKANSAYNLANGKYTKPGTGIPESDLSSDLKNKIAGKTDRSQVCSEWHSQTAYTTTSVVLRDGKFYLCKTAHTSGSVWDGTKWEETTLDKVMEQYGKLTPIYADGGWSCDPSSVTHGYYGEIRDLRVVHTNEWWNLQGTRVDNEQTVTITGVSYDSSAVELTFSDGSITPSSVSASRSYALYLVGYTLGSQSDKPLLAKDAYPISIGNGSKTVAYNATNYIDIGKDTTIRGSNTMAFGHSSTAGGDNAMAIGPNANVQTDNAMALGSNTTASGTQALAIGNGANAAAYGQAEGLGATAVTDGTATGFQAHAYGSGVAIGAHAEINGGESIAIGHNAFATANNAGQIGPGTNSTADTLKYRYYRVVGPQGDVAPTKRHKTDLAVYDFADAVASFPNGFSCTWSSGGGTVVTYEAPSGGAQITFVGPVAGIYDYNYWYPSDAPSGYGPASGWCLCAPNHGVVPATMMYKTGVTYDIYGGDSGLPVLVISTGSESGGHPTLSRPIDPTGDVLVKDSELAGKADEETPIAKLPSNCYPVIMTDSLGTEYTILETDATFTRYDRNSPYELNKVGFFSACIFDESTGKLSEYAAPFVSAKFNGTEGIIGTWPVITRYPSGGTVVRDQKLLGKVDSVYNATSGNIPVLTQNGGIRDSTIPAADVAMKGEIRYTLPNEVTVISSASQEDVGGETVYYGEATLADRTQNQVAVLVSIDELRVSIPSAISGKAREFGLIVIVGLGEGTALAAPKLVPIAPTGETIVMMNAEGEMPTLADGTTTASGMTVFCFTEIGSGAFLVKGEQLKQIMQ